MKDYCCFALAMWSKRQGSNYNRFLRREEISLYTWWYTVFSILHQLKVVCEVLCWHCVEGLRNRQTPKLEQCVWDSLHMKHELINTIPQYVQETSLYIIHTYCILLKYKNYQIYQKYLFISFTYYDTKPAASPIDIFINILAISVLFFCDICITLLIFRCIGPLMSYKCISSLPLFFHSFIDIFNS